VTHSERLIAILLRTPTKSAKILLASYGVVAVIGLLTTRGDCDLRLCVELNFRDTWMLWTFAWALYSGLKFWRIWAAPIVERPRAALFINFYGVCLYAAWTVPIVDVRAPAWFASAGDIVLLIGAMWVCICTSPLGNIYNRWGESE
jgi:hypothetical protein